MHIEFIRIDNEAKEQPAGIAFMKDGEVTFEGVPSLIQLELRKYGIVQADGVLHIDQGEAFLAALPLQYSGSRFRAKRVD